MNKLEYDKLAHRWTNLKPDTVYTVEWDDIWNKLTVDVKVRSISATSKRAHVYNWDDKVKELALDIVDANTEAPWK